MNNIYVIEQEGGLTKVGISNNPNLRLASLQEISPKRLHLRAAFPCSAAAEIEQSVLSSMRDKIVIGEWMSISVDEAINAVVREIGKHANPDADTADTVTIPLSRYMELLRAREDLLTRQNDCTPDESARPHIAEGESKLSAWRRFRRLSQSDLSKKCGINRIQISNIERGARNGSAATLKAIAAALSVKIDDIV